MTHPLSLTRPLLIHVLAAALLCPVAFAKTKSKRTESAKTAETAKSTPEKQAATTKGKQAGGTQPEAPANSSARKNTDTKSAVQPAKPATNSASTKPNIAKTAPVATAVPPRAKAVSAPVQRQTQGDGPPRGSGNDHRSLIVPPEELRARVPASGPLGEEDCILLAISNSPQLDRRRAGIMTAIAERQKEKDWENPELRLSYGSQSDDFIRNPYTERTIENLSESENYTSTDTTTLLNSGDIGFDETTVDRETGTTTTTRYREIERIVTPGRFGDTVTTNIFDRRVTADSAIRDRTVTLNGVSGIPRQDSLVENVERTLRSTATETTASSAENGNQETFSALVRLNMPHPWVKKARLARAAAEITLAEAQYLADEDKLVREVRALFHDLNEKESTLQAHQRRRANFAAFRTEMEGAPIADFATDAARASIDMASVLEDTLKTGNDADKIRALLARYCGITDFRRIRSSGIVTRRIVDMRQFDQAYLVEMAMLYRADAVESRGRLGIARALLDEAKAAKIPWATFIDAGYTHQWRDGYSGAEDEWMIRIGLEIPFFDWTKINKRDEAYKQAAIAWERQFETQRRQVQVDVTIALDHLKIAQARLYQYDRDIKKEQADIKERLAKAEKLAGGLSGFTKNLRIKYDAEDATQILEIGRYRSYSDYNEAVMELENAIGIRIEKVLSGQSGK